VFRAFHFKNRDHAMERNSLPCLHLLNFNITFINIGLVRILLQLIQGGLDLADLFSPSSCYIFGKSYLCCLISSFPSNCEVWLEQVDCRGGILVLLRISVATLLSFLSLIVRSSTCYGLIYFHHSNILFMALKLLFNFQLSIDAKQGHNVLG